VAEFEIEIASTMGSGSLRWELDLRPLVAGLAENAETPIDTNFTSEGLVTIYLGDDSSRFILYRTGSFQIRGAKTEADLERAESQFRTLLSGVGLEMPEYEFRHVTSVFVGTFETDVSLNALTIALGLEQTEHEQSSSQRLCIDRQSLRRHSSSSQLAR
jgi:transcription initiation factor TFIID TATA-box-binding protein